MTRGLVEQAQAGDRDAFARLAADAVDRLYRVAWRILRDADAAHDATQQALLEAWRDLPSLRDPERWEAWTYRLVVHAAGKQQRRERGFGARVHLLAPTGETPDGSAALSDRDALERAFRVLPVEQRAVVVLHHVQGLSLEEVARLLGIPAGTARSRLHVATRRLRAALAEDDRLPDLAPETRP